MPRAFFDDDKIHLVFVDKSCLRFFESVVGRLVFVSLVETVKRRRLDGGSAFRELQPGHVFGDGDWFAQSPGPIFLRILQA